jgi:uncharacterized protein YndB with AHSA1/START domain
MKTTQAGVLVVHLHVERTIAASPEQVFDWLTDPANLTSAPLFIWAGWAKGFSGPSVGATREVTAVGAWFREEITASDAPRSYSYRVVRSFPASKHEGGTLTFTPSGDGTHVDWVVTYTIPARAGGRVTEARHFAAVPQMLPRDPRGMREGVGELLVSAHAFQIAGSS